MTNKIPPGEYSVENGKLRITTNGFMLCQKYSADDAIGVKPIATIGFSMPGIPQLHIRERSAEEWWKENHNYISLNGMEYIEKEKFLQYTSQLIAPVSEEEIESMAKTFSVTYATQGTIPEITEKALASEHGYLAGYRAALSRTQSGYTREQVETVVLHICTITHSKDWVRTNTKRIVQDISNFLASLTPSITRVTIGHENNIVNIKYK